MCEKEKARDVCVRKRKKKKAIECVCERERVCVYERVCVREKVCVCLCTWGVIYAQVTVASEVLSWEGFYHYNFSGVTAK